MTTPSLRTRLAIGLGKGTAALVSCLRLGAGTSLPGKLARRVDGNLLQSLGSQVAGRTVGVTGTNGKTTTCGLLAGFLRQAGRHVVHNHLGANMAPGITAALLLQSDWRGRLHADAAVLEVDEASLRGVAADVPIERLVVTNLFRDQLDRYGELDTTARLIAAGIEAGRIPRLLLNADDPLVTMLGRGHRGEDQPEGSQVIFFGVDAEVNTTPSDCPVGFPREVTQCPACGAGLHYRQTVYGHLGHYDCPACGYHRPRPQVAVEQLHRTPTETRLTLRWGETREEIHLPLPGLFNVYNLLAAAAVAYDLGLPSRVLQAGIEGYQSVFGRAERKHVHGKSVLVMLIKNPVGASEVLKLVASDPQSRLLIAMNDLDADGRDVSWIWDADFEALGDSHPTEDPHDERSPLVISGRRAEDMALRLKYAGIPEDRLVVIPDLKAAVAQALAQTHPDETLYILPTYTALLEMRNILPE